MDPSFIGLHVKGMLPGESFTVSKNWLANGRGHPRPQVPEHQNTLNKIHV